MQTLTASALALGLRKVPGRTAGKLERSAGKLEQTAAGAAGALERKAGTLERTGSARNQLPIPEPVIAKNGLKVESNTKHTPGMPGNRPNAGVEPKNSLELFNSSIEGGPKTRYAIDSSGNINRFINDGRGGPYHWAGSTNDLSVPLDVSTIPSAVKRALGFTGK